MAKQWVAIIFLLFVGFLFIGRAEAAPPLISLVASSTDKMTAVVTWQTDQPATSTIEYGTSLSYGRASSTEVLSTNTTFYLGGLISSSTYHFKVISTNSSGETSSSTGYVFTTKPNMYGLNAKKVVWLSTTTMRATYDWTDDGQLDDWTPTTGSSLTRGTSTVDISDGITNVNAMIWDQAIAVSKIRARARNNNSEHINIYSNLSSQWKGTPWDPNPSLGHIWRSDPSWIVDGSAPSSGGSPPGVGNWHDYEFQASSTMLRAWSSIDDTWYERSGSYSPTTTGVVAMGAFSTINHYGQVSLEGEVAVSSDTDPPIIYNIVSSTMITEADVSWETDELASSSIFYGTTNAYGHSSSSEVFSNSHSISLSGLTPSTTYYFSIVSEDNYGNKSSSTGSFQTVPDTSDPVVTSFNIQEAASELTVSVSELTASDNVAVAAYLLTTSATTPDIGASDWRSSPPDSYTFSSEGIKVLYAWAKDGSGNVSVGLSDSVVITLDESDDVGPRGTSPGGFADISKSPPPYPSGFKATGTDEGVLLSWSNPAANDLAGIKIFKGAGSLPSGHSNEIVYNGLEEMFVDASSTETGRVYYYSISAYDTAGNHSGFYTISIFLPEDKAEDVSASAPETLQAKGLFGAESRLVEEVSAQEAERIIITQEDIILNEEEQLIFKRIADMLSDDMASRTEREIKKFISKGSPTTIKLGAGERGGALSSFITAFRRYPSDHEDWKDVIKIGNGRWPKNVSERALDRAKRSFAYIYKRRADMQHPNDNAAVTIMAYGLRPALRDLKSEMKAIDIYETIFKRPPLTTTAWDAVRAIAYSGAVR